MNIKKQDLLKLKKQKLEAYHKLNTGVEKTYTKERLAQLERDNETIDMELKKITTSNRSVEELEETEKRFNSELSDPDGSITFLNSNIVKYYSTQMLEHDFVIYKRDMLIYYKDLAFGNQNIVDITRAIKTWVRINKEYPCPYTYNAFKDNFE
jgi:hypothetical protein